MTNVQPRVLLTGAAAVSAAAKLLPTARAMTVNSSLGQVRLVPGTVWGGDKVLIDCSDMVVHYMDGAQLYECPTQMFVRDDMLRAIASGGAKAEWLVELAKIEQDFLFGLFVPAYGMVGLTCAKVLVVYANHRPAFAAARKYLPSIVSDLLILKRENPTLFRVVFGRAGGEIITNLPRGVSAEDIAFWAGRIIMGLYALTKGSLSAPPMVPAPLTAAGITKVFVIVTTLVGLLHASGMAVRAGGIAIKQASLEAELKKLQLFISSIEANHIVMEMKQAHQSRTALLRLKDSMPAVLPSLQELAVAWRKAS